MSAIVDFYHGSSADYLGRTLEQILAWDDDRLEVVHNYIQVLFPLPEESLFVSCVPLLDTATIAEFQRDEKLRHNLGRAFERMLAFYGLKREPATGKIERAANFAERAANWLDEGNHNHRRITRILRCLMTLGLPDRARAFFDCLKEIRAEHRHDINNVTFAYWAEAVSSIPPPPPGSTITSRPLE